MPCLTAAYGAESPDAPSLAAWWTTLNDPTLNDLIQRALAENKTVKQALGRVVEARARRGVTTADFFPSVDAVRRREPHGFGDRASARRAPSMRISRPRTMRSTAPASTRCGSSIFFGGKRRALEASTAQLAATEADLRDALVTLLGDVALSYTNVRTAQSRLTFAERNLKAQSDVLDITRWRAEAGLVGVLDVEQAKTELRPDACADTRRSNRRWNKA